jgi:peptidoglycan-N-acetylglucosamine deacetylase
LRALPLDLFTRSLKDDNILLFMSLTMKEKKKVVSPAQALGIILLAVAALVFFFNPFLSIAVALFYIVLCFMAAFFPETNFFLPVISRGATGEKCIALTFDDGPAEPTTRQILHLLDKYSMKATFFVSGVNAQSHPEIIREIIARGHTVGNHSFHHNPFLMLNSYKTIYREIFAVQDILERMGIKTLIFRPPVGIVNPKLAPILDKLGMYCVTFSCRAYDAGNRYIRNISRKILQKVKADDIILLHDVPPPGGKNNEILIMEMESLLSGLAYAGWRVVPLDILIKKQVMIKEST